MQRTKIVDSIAEFTDSEIKELFEEYRYGQNLFFRVFRFNRGSANELHSVEPLRQRLEDAFRNIQVEDEATADTKSYKLNDLKALPGQPSIVEGNFRYLQRLDYIDEIR